MSHYSFDIPADALPTAVRPWAVALATSVVLALAGCGGDDIAAVTPPPPLTGAGPQATPSTATIVAAQAGIDGAAGPSLAASGVPTDAQLVVAQKAIDGATTDGSNINTNQAAMDANGVQPYKMQ